MGKKRLFLWKHNEEVIRDILRIYEVMKFSL